MHSYNLVERGPAPEKANKALLLVHGRGATAGDILQLADYFAGDDWYIAAPQATNHTWYPYSFMVPVVQNQPWLDSAVKVLHRLIEDTAKHVPADRIYLMGFSQGACLSSEAACRHARRYGGLAIFTGGLIGAQPGYELYQGNFADTPVYLSNGDRDPHVPATRTEETQVQLEEMGAKVTVDIFPGRPHMISPDEIERAKAVLGG